MNPFWERVLDRIENPIMIRELRGSFRRRRTMFLLSFLLVMVSAAVLATMFVSSGKGDPAETGRKAFLAFLAVQVGLVLLVFPSFSCAGITEERLNRSFDLLITTRLRARNIAMGKMLAALSFSLIFLIATAPLVAITFLYGGVTVGQIFFTYLLLLLLTLVVTSYGLLMSSLSDGTARAVVQTFLSLPIIVPLTLYPLFIHGVMPYLYAPLSKEREALKIREEFLALDQVTAVFLWIADLTWVAVWVTLFFLLATNRLKPARADRSTSLRLWFLVSWISYLVFALVPLAVSKLANPSQGMAVFMSVVVGALAVSAVAFAIGSPGDVPRKDRRLTWWRLPISPGAERGALFVMLMALLTFCAASIVFTYPADLASALPEADWRPPLTILAWGVAWGLVFLFALTQGALLLSRWLKHASLARVWLALCLGIAVGYPALWYLVEDREAKGSFYKGYALSPVTVARSVFQDAKADDRRLIVFGPSVEEIRERMRSARRDKGLRGREELESFKRDMLEEGVAVHKLSIALYLFLGLGLLGLNIRSIRRQGRAARAPPTDQQVAAESEDDGILPDTTTAALEEGAPTTLTRALEETSATELAKAAGVDIKAETLILADTAAEITMAELRPPASPDADTQAQPASDDGTVEDDEDDPPDEEDDDAVEADEAEPAEAE